ncbi:MAG: hypothetical protein WKF71_13725 [Pyrinomonadaceae bacterium]
MRFQIAIGAGEIARQKNRDGKRHGKHAGRVRQRQLKVSRGKLENT